jgi:hypothetical protein
MESPVSGLVPFLQYSTTAAFRLRSIENQGAILREPLRVAEVDPLGVAWRANQFFARYVVPAWGNAVKDFHTGDSTVERLSQLFSNGLESQNSEQLRTMVLQTCLTAFVGAAVAEPSWPG